MHRQSLSSPSKLNINGVIVPKDDNPKLDDLSSSFIDGADDEVRKSQKSTPKPETLIHLIPILTLLCFLILYLSSHDPSQKDLAQFNGFNRLSKLIDDANEIDNYGRILDSRQDDVLTIRSQRSLQEMNRLKTKVHRKIGYI